MICIYCGNEIPEGRLKIFPNAKTCVNCSTAEKVTGFAMIDGKTEYSSLQILDKKTFKRLKDLDKTKGRV